MTRSLILAVFVLLTANGYCQNLITFQSPAQNAVADALLHVSCQVSSVMEISSVKATVGTEEITLSLSDNHFVGDLSLTELAPGGLTLTVTVTNVENASFSKSVNFIYDPKPSIIFEESLSDVVARPLLTIKAKCEELDGLPCSMSVKFGAELSPNPEVLTFAVRSTPSSTYRK